MSSRSSMSLDTFEFVALKPRNRCSLSDRDTNGRVPIEVSSSVRQMDCRGIRPRSLSWDPRENWTAKESDPDLFRGMEYRLLSSSALRSGKLQLSTTPSFSRKVQPQPSRGKATSILICDKNCEADGTFPSCC